MINLLERKSELTEIRALMRSGGVMVAEGRAGLGKTSMLDAACALVLLRHKRNFDTIFWRGAAQHGHRDRFLARATMT
jgi:ABC-type transport system involved in cytochrome c biogenesis ATPase subunit